MRSLCIVLWCVLRVTVLVPVAWAQYTPAVHTPIPYPTTVNVKAPPYNCVGNGIADDTPCLQTALNAFGVSPNTSGSVFLPLGTYKITQTLTYTGAPGLGLRLQGEVGGTRGPTATMIKWAGASAGTMLYTLGMNNSVIEHLEFFGNTSAKIGLQLDATNVDLGSGAGSSGVVLRHVTISGLTGAGNVGLLLAHTPPGGTNQISEVWLYDCHLLGDGSTTTSAGIKTMSGGNAKDYWMSGGRLTGWGSGLDWIAASGVFTVSYVSLGNLVQDVKVGTGALTLIGVESEASGIQFVTGTTGQNPGVLTIIGSSWQASTLPDDIMISYTGAVVLIGNSFYNLRTGASLPRIEVADAAMSGTIPASITSIGNHYDKATGTAPFYDTAHVALGTGATGELDIAVTSLGDTGGVGGAMVHLPSIVPADAARPQLRTFATLGTTAPAGTLRYCSDCTIATPCAGSGTGAIAKRLGGAWICN